MWQMLHVHIVTFTVDTVRRRRSQGGVLLPITGSLVEGVTTSTVCVELRCWEICPPFIECVGRQVVKKQINFVGSEDDW